jgi:DNA-binding beta-propeller fold protein YncE
VRRRTFLISSAVYGLGVRGCAPPEAVALVTADTEAHVAEVDLSTGRVRRRIATLAGPRSIEAAPGGCAVVAHTESGAVSLLERRPVEVRRVLEGFGEPRYTAVHPSGRWAYVTDSAEGALHVIDLDRGRVIRTVAVGALARHLTITPDGKALWVALGNRAPTIVRLDVADPARPRPWGQMVPPFLAHDVGCAPDGIRVWVTSGDRSSVAIFRRGRLQAVLPAGKPPQHVTFMGDRAYVTSGDSSTLTVHRAGDGAALATTAVPAGSYNVQRGGRWVLTPSLEQGTLVIADGGGRETSRTAVAAAAHDACVLGAYGK